MPDRRREKPQQVADELRKEIIGDQLADGTPLGHEADLIERFGVSRPSLREALRILEVDGLITVVRGVNGGIVARQPDRRQTARTAALVLQSRNVSLTDVSEARTIIEPSAVRLVASARYRKRSTARLAELIDQQEAAIDDPAGFGQANALFHEELIALAGNETLTVVAEMLYEIVARAVTSVSSTPRGARDVTRTRERGVRSQRRLVELISAGDADGAEQHWKRHMEVVGKVILGQDAKSTVDLMHHY